MNRVTACQLLDYSNADQNFPKCDISGHKSPNLTQMDFLSVLKLEIHLEKSDLKQYKTEKKIATRLMFNPRRGYPASVPVMEDTLGVVHK
ncbi:hypothetical protein AVEN_87815-1 [Araneus ventricosus]|uniref:Uncharacterized protein n=1 Tax=Araneus ventricosus TaxID=182803 RepID=A0A4Y2BBP4_ARAVE|nr:hypothetical protein AVEN_87815-1 [Araneus ventricosus]